VRVHDCNLMGYAKTRITMLITALHIAVGSNHPRPLRDAHSSRRILHIRRAPRQSLRSVPMPTNILHNTVMVCLQQLALLVPTLRPTSWQQLVSTARRRRRRRRRGNCRRVGWAVARRCERQRRGSQHAGTAVCRTHHCRSGTRMPWYVLHSSSSPWA